MGSLGVSKQETAPITASVQIHVKHPDKNVSKNCPTCPVVLNDSF